MPAATVDADLGAREREPGGDGETKRNLSLADGSGEGVARDSERRYRILFERNPTPMWLVDEETWKFIDVNEAAIAHYGYSRAEFLAMSVAEIRENGSPPSELLAAPPSPQDGRQHFACRHRRKDGSVIDVEVVADSAELDGRRTRLALITDVTMRRRMESQLRESQKIEAIGLLAGGVAHDFNNILTAIHGYVELLLLSCAPDDERFSDLTEIKKAAGSATALTRQLLAFGRKQLLKPTLVDLNAVVSHVRSMLQRVIGEDVEIVVRFGRSLGRVLVDAGQMEQVLLNLAVNARDAMPSGGTLNIATTNVDLDAGAAAERPGLKPGPYVRLSVSDSGTGMSAHVLAHAFEPFFTTKAPGRGTGLGLSTVHGIITQSGGYIAVDSIEGVGTTFEMLFPHAAVAQAGDDTTAGDETTAPVPRGTETILLVEDESAVRDLAHRVLSQCGYRVLTAVNGKDALAVSDRHEGQIDLVFTDAVMPEMGGSDLIRELRGTRRPGIKVLLTSGYTEDAVLRRDIRSGMSPCLDKPFTPAQLARTVRQVLDSAV